MKKLKGGYYTLVFNPKVINELGLEQGSSKNINKDMNNPFIKRLNELEDKSNGTFKTDKPILIQFSNDDGNFACKFNDSVIGAIELMSLDGNVLTIMVLDSTSYSIQYGTV